MLDEAIAAVTDCANLSAFGHSGSGFRTVRKSEIIGALRSRGLDATEAKVLAREAVAHVGGYVERGTHVGGLAAGRRRRTPVETWWIPVSAISEPGVGRSAA
jgi:hypothetical protein